MACMLLIYQDPVQAYLLAMLLEAESIDPIICHGLEQALAVCDARNDIDGVLLDLQTLKADVGPLPARRHWSRHSSMPILGVSSYYDESDAEHICREFYLDGYLSLPVNPQRFQQCIQHLLRDHVGQPSALEFQSCS
ncbi:MAG: hypothetical protein NPIRA02_03310 [Nitrospirales bacterium]|nr:MAG: hypothetical protein NPIRA02_03310 [Nitrospirales bacterium]